MGSIHNFLGSTFHCRGLNDQAEVTNGKIGHIPDGISYEKTTQYYRENPMFWYNIIPIDGRIL
jgi:hypothetical protein